MKLIRDTEFTRLTDTMRNYQKSRWVETLKLLASITCLCCSLFFWLAKLQQRPSDSACIDLLYPPCTYCDIAKASTCVICDGSLTSAAPANEAVEYHLVNYLDLSPVDTIFQGPPTPEREAGWSSITPDLC